MKKWILYIMAPIICLQVLNARGLNTAVIANDTLKSDTVITIIPLTFNNQSDTIRKSDPILEYINQRRSKNKFNDWVGGLLVRNDDTTTTDESLNYIKEYKRLSQKTIASIHITRLDPFGTSINDTTKHATKWIERTGNNMRFTTSKRIIKKNLTVKEGMEFDPRSVFESERVLRQLNFIAVAKIMVDINPQDTSQVELFVITRDRFPHAFSTNGDVSSPEVTLYSRNLTGHGVGFSHTWEFDYGRQIGNQEQLTINNFNRSRINLEANYTDLSEENSLSLRADRSFYISDLKYAGGAYYNRSYKDKQHPAFPQIVWDDFLDFRYSNIWMGRSFEIETQNYFDRSHIYIIGQYSRSHFLNLPDSISHIEALADNQFYYGSFTFSKRNYYQNNKIYNYDRTEDVPYGFMGTITVGYNKQPSDIRPYLRGHLSFGKAIIPNRGYLYGRIEAGSFFKDGHSEQGEISMKTKYISRLFEVGNNQFRNFIEVNYIKGFNRYSKEYLYLTERSGSITSFRDNELKGKERLVVKTENVLFTQHRLMGFNLMVLSFADIGIIGDGKHNLFKQDYQASLGAAVRFINNKLVFRTIEIRLAWLPMLPEGEFPLDLRISGESSPRFDDFVPGAPKQNTFK
nr:hypothetical protein [uncultured Carboxylicivirga sp.]